MNAGQFEPCGLVEGAGLQIFQILFGGVLVLLHPTQEPGVLEADGLLGRDGIEISPVFLSRLLPLTF